MKEKTLKKLSKWSCMILSVALMLTLLTPLLSLSAFAVKYEIGTVISDDRDVEILAGGRPNTDYVTTGNYYFWLQHNDNTSKVELYYCKDGGTDTVVPSKEGGISSKNTVMRYNGIQISREDDKSFGYITKRDKDDGDEGSEGAKYKDIGVSVFIKEVGRDSKAPEDTANIKSTGGSIREGKNKELVFSVFDPDTPHSEITPNSASVSFSSSAFALQSGKSPTAVPIEKEDGDSEYAEFIVTIPVKYSGKGDAITFDIVYDAGELGQRRIKNTEKIPNTVESDDDDDEDEDDDELPDPEPLTPYVIVESYSYGDGEVIAGENFELELTLKNTSKEHTLENIVMNIAPQGVFSMGGSSNTIYIDSLFVNSTVKKTVTINTGLTKVTDDEDANSISMDFSFQYVVEDVRTDGESTENIALPVTFPDRFELSPPEVDGTGYIMEEIYIYQPMVNKGRSSVYNVAAVIAGEGIINPGQTQYIGNIEAGSDSSADFAIIYDVAGEYTGEIIITYEDTNMEPKETTIPFEVSVAGIDDFGGGMDDMGGMGDMEDMGDWDDPILPTGPIEPIEEEEDPIKDIMLIVGGVIAIIAAYITVKKAKVKRSIFTDEEF